MRFLLDLLWPPTLEGRIVNALLYALWVIGVGLAIRNLLRVRREHAVLDGVPAGPPDAEGVAPALPETLADLFNRLGLATRDAWQSPCTALGRRLRHLWQVRGVGRSGVDALAEVFSSREAMGLEASRYLTSILVLLGLAGTILGLHDLLGNLTRAADQNSYGGLLQALQPMRTAFSCTLVGILTSVTLAGLLGYVERQQNDFVTQLEELVTVQVIPLIFPPSETQQLQRMQAILARSGEFVREFGEAIARGQELFSEKLTDAMREAGVVFAAGLKEAGKGLEVSLDSVASQVRAVIGQLEGSLASMQQSGCALGESARSLLEYREELKRDRLELQALLRETNQSVVAIVRQSVAPLEQSGERIGRTAEALAEVKEQLVADSRQHEAMVAAFIRQGERSAEERRADIVAFAQSAERDRALLAEEAGRGLAAAQAIRQSMETASSWHVEAALRFEELANAVRPEALRLPNGQMLGDRLGEIAAGLDTLTERLNAIEHPQLADRLSEVAEGLQVVAEHLFATESPQPPEQLGEAVTLLGQVAAGLEGVAGRLATLEGACLPQRWGEIATGISNANERLGAMESTRLPERMEGIAVTLERVAMGLASLASHAAVEADTRAQLVTLQCSTLAALRDVQHRMNQPLWRLLLPNGAHAVGEIA